MYYLRFRYFEENHPILPVIYHDRADDFHLMEALQVPISEVRQDVDNKMMSFIIGPFDDLDTAKQHITSFGKNICDPIIIEPS